MDLKELLISVNHGFKKLLILVNHGFKKNHEFGKTMVFRIHKIHGFLREMKDQVCLEM